jgi:hypothetical protein
MKNKIAKVNASCWGESVGKVESALRAAGLSIFGVEHMSMSIVEKETIVGVETLAPGNYCQLTFKVLVKI